MVPGRVHKIKWLRFRTVPHKETLSVSELCGRMSSGLVKPKHFQFETYFQINVAAVLFRLCGRIADLFRTKTGNDQNGDPELFQDEASCCSNRTWIPQDNDLKPKIRAVLNILDHISPEENMKDRPWEILHNRALCREEWKKTTAVRNTKAASAPTECYLKDPFTFITASTQR